MRTILCLALLCLLLMPAFGQPGVRTDNPPIPKTIHVTGSAELEIVPDEIYVQVTLSEYDKRGAGKIQLETIKMNFLSACKQAGVPDSAISVASYQGYDRWYWRKRKKNPDMNATISYEIKFSNTEQIDGLVDRLDDEATQSFSIVGASHSNITELRKQLKIQAVKAAKEKANYLAEAIGEKAGEAITINEPGESVDRFNQGLLSNALIEEKNKAGVPTPTAYKKLKLRYEVNAVFALK